MCNVYVWQKTHTHTHTHTQQNMHDEEKHQKLHQGKEGGDQNWGWICKGFKILLEVLSQGQEIVQKQKWPKKLRFNKAG